MFVMQAPLLTINAVSSFHPLVQCFPANGKSNDIAGDCMLVMQASFGSATFGKTEPDRRCSCFASYSKQVSASSGRCFCLSVIVCRHLLFRMSHTCAGNTLSV